jgi:uncharacterized protein YcbK (DUF882 family)
MIHTVNKGCIVKITPDFAFYEFDCPCNQCTQTLVSQELPEMLQKLREYTKFPIMLTSGYRCAYHQQELRDKGYETAIGPSSHEMGLAADIECGAFSGSLLADYAAKAGFQNIGIAKRMIHVDLRPGGPRRWEYKTI